MPTAIALLRGINVGGKNVLPMTDLRALCESIGLDDPRTYIQSGNVVFAAPAREIARAAKRLEAAIEKSRGLRVGVVVRTLDELAAVIKTSPFKSVADREPGKLIVMFLTQTPSAEARRALAALNQHPEKVALAGDEVFIHFPNGAGRARLTMAMIERAAGVSGTCRNWNTVLKLAEMGNGE